MRILDKYLIKEFIPPFLFGVIIFSTILLSSWILTRMVKLMVNYNVSIVTASKLFFLSLPSVIVLTLPMATLLACLLALSRLSTDNEILAIKTSGVSFLSISFPIILLSAFISLSSIVIREVITPITNEYYHRIYVKEVVRKNPELNVKGQVFIKELEKDTLKRLLYAERYDKKLNSLINVLSLEFQEGRHVQTIKAKRAVHSNNGWIFYHGKIDNYDDQENLRQTLRFDKQKVEINYTKQDILRSIKKEEEMTYREIKAHIKFLRQHGIRGVNLNELLVELYLKLATSAASIIFALIGIPIAMRARVTTSIGIGISALIILIYFIILTLSTTAGKMNIIHPAIAAFLPNIIFLIIGIILMLKQQRI